MSKKYDITTRAAFIVDKPFQLKYSFLLVVLGGIIALVFAGHVFYFLNENVQVFIPNYKDNVDVARVIFDQQKEIALYLLALILVLVSFIFFMGIIITHRIVGPIMVIRRKMEDFASGNLEARVHLRKRDEFQELANSFNNMAEIISQRLKSEEDRGDS